MFPRIEAIFVVAGLLYSESYYQVFVVCAVLGLIKGAATVYMFLILPSCLPVEKLPAAGGVMMLGCGIFLMIFGPIMGKYFDIKIFIF